MTLADPARLKAQFVRICECGCGQPTNLAAETHNSHGIVKGQPQRYLRGHSGRKGRLDIEAIAALYRSGAPLSVVAEQFETTQATIRARLKEAGVPTRTRANFGLRNGRWVETPSPNTARQRAERYFPEPEPCVHCGSTTRPTRHHKDLNPANNIASNIEWLCASCHTRYHRALQRAARNGDAT